jgi:hypothetical protein
LVMRTGSLAAFSSAPIAWTTHSVSSPPGSTSGTFNASRSATRLLSSGLPIFRLRMSLLSG